MWRSHGCLGGTGDNRALITLLVLLVPLNVTYPDERGKYEPSGIMPLYLFLSDPRSWSHEVGKKMKGVFNVCSFFLKPGYCIITWLILFGWCKFETLGLKNKAEMHIFACKMYKLSKCEAAALRKICFSDIYAWLEIFPLRSLLWTEW